MIVDLSDLVENGSLEIKEHVYVLTFKNLNNAQATFIDLGKILLSQWASPKIGVHVKSVNKFDIRKLRHV